MVIFLYFKMIESIVFIWIIKNYIYNLYKIIKGKVPAADMAINNKIRLFIIHTSFLAEY